MKIQFNSDIAKDNDEVRIALYSNIGFFIEVAQMLEFNLRKLICYEKSVLEIESGDITKERVIGVCDKYDDIYDKTYNEKWTLGHITSELSKGTKLTEEFINFIKEINTYRNAVVHKIFQNNIVCKELCLAENASRYISDRLIPMTDKTIELNRAINKIINAYKKSLHDYKRKFGIPFEE